MLHENAYTTEELIHYAGIDDRYKPLLADRLARDGMPEPDTDEVDELSREIEELRPNVLDSVDQERWLDALDVAIEAVDDATAQEDIEAAAVFLQSALRELKTTRDSIAAHAAA